MGAEEIANVAGFAVTEKQMLGGDAAAAVDGDGCASLVPGAQVGFGIWVEVGAVVAVFVAVSPNQTLRVSAAWLCGLHRSIAAEC